MMTIALKCGKCGSFMLLTLSLALPYRFFIKVRCTTCQKICEFERTYLREEELQK